MIVRRHQGPQSYITICTCKLLSQQPCSPFVKFSIQQPYPEFWICLEIYILERFVWFGAQLSALCTATH